LKALQKSLFLLIMALILSQVLMAQLVAGGDTTICQGGQAQLTANGGGASYYWTSYPTDPSLLIPQTQNPVVSPQVSTMYVVQSNIATGNLILNGSFELGVMGFSSEYVNNQISIVAEGTYAVVNDAHTVHPNFWCNHDHTSGSGKMMAVNGSGVPNVKVWYLTLTNVEPGTRYEFSTWITSLHETNPALLQFSINGQLMGQPFQAYPYTCDWYQFFHIWDSDTNDQATISIVNQNTILSGNDFALDDISFATVLVYYDTVYVEVLPQYNSPFTAPANACAQEAIMVDYTGNAPDTAHFHWDFDGGTVISGSGPGPYEITYPTSGNPGINLWVDGYGCASDTTLHMLAIGESPVVTVSADQTILPYGSNTTLHGSYTGGLGPFEFLWQPSGLLVNPSSPDPQTVAMEYTTTFILSVTDLSAECTGYDTIVIQVAGGPLGITVLAEPDEICPGEQAILTAQGLGGTENYTYSWTSNPSGFSSTLPQVIVQPAVTTEYMVTVNDGLSSANESVFVTVNSIPIAYAGSDVTIPYGAYTHLQGNGIGGSGTYTYQWEPSSLVMNPNLSSTQTLNLTTSTVFSLVVTDAATGCLSTADEVIVFIEGGPLSANIYTDHTEICDGDTAHLTALASGGNPDNYTYLWTDDYGNAYPSSQTITVIPSQTTNFHLIVNDGFNTTDDFLELIVNPSTEFAWNTGQGYIYACPMDTVSLVPNPNPATWDYLWSDGSTDDHLVVGSTGIGFEQKTITLTTSNDEGCQYSGSMTVIFDFSYCSGIGDDKEQDAFSIFPNPNSGIFRIEGGDLTDISVARIYNETGKLVYSASIDKNSGKIIIEMSEAPPGIYFIRLISGNHEPLQKILVIQR